MPHTGSRRLASTKNELSLLKGCSFRVRILCELGKNASDDGVFLCARSQDIGIEVTHAATNAFE